MQGDNIVNTKEYSNRGKGDKHVIKFKSIPDELGKMDQKADYLSWKRMCMAIIKNDITCQTLSFSITKNQQIKQQELIAKYKKLL